MVLQESRVITKVIAIHPEGGLNICTEFHGGPSNSCWDAPAWDKAGDQPTGRADVALNGVTESSWLKRSHNLFPEFPTKPPCRHWSRFFLRPFI